MEKYFIMPFSLFVTVFCNIAKILLDRIKIKIYVQRAI